MSYGTGGPFDPQAPQQGQRAYPQSYNDPGYQQPPQGSSNRTLFIILGSITAVILLGALACCGFGYFGFQYFTTEMSRQFQPQIENSPEIVEHIGDIQEMTLNFQETQRLAEPGAMVFDVRGSKGSGQIVVDSGRMHHEPDEAFELILPDGTRMPITEVADPRARFRDPEPQIDAPPPAEAPPPTEARPPAEAPAPVDPPQGAQPEEAPLPTEE